jgi:inner membrane protein
MPTILSHPAVAIAAAPYFRGRLPRGLLFLGAVCSSIPDADVGAFGLGIPYEHPLGHRGFTHSILFALLFSAFATFAYRRLTRTPASVFAIFTFLLICIGSHGALDAMTDGGKGIGFLIPFDNRRFFFPFRPIHVAPIGLDAPAAVLASEAKWVWLPGLAVAAIGWAFTFKRRQP